MERRDRLAAVRIYLIATPEAHGPGWREALEAALDTGLVGMVQLRDKALDDDAYLELALSVRRRCRPHDALFIVNDRVALAIPAGADGAHVGQADQPPEEARVRLGDSLLLGLSTHDEAEVAGAAERGADHVGLGAVFPTNTKQLERAPEGADLVQRCLPHANGLPVFPIGGITADNVGLLAAAGARRVAVGAGVLEAEDPAAAVRAIDAALPPLS